MADWVDEEDGRGFGNGCSQYKENVDEYVDDGKNDYTEQENTDDGNRGFGNRRGRGGIRGRGGRGPGGSYGGGHRNFGDNEDSAQPTEFQSSAQNFVPKNFMETTIQEFLPEVPGRIQRTNSLDELYCIVKYLLKAYKICLSTEMNSNNTSSANVSTEQMVTRNGDNNEMQQEKEKFDIDQENFNVIDDVEVDTTANENIEMLDLIGGKRKADYGMQLEKSNGLATANHSQLSDLPDLFKDVMPSTHEQQQTPTSTTFRKPRKIPGTDPVRGVSHQNQVAGIASLELIPNMVGAYVTEREYALRKRLPNRSCLRMVPEDHTIINNMRTMAYNFFPIENMWTKAVSAGMEEEMQQIPPLVEDQPQLREEGSAMTSASINVARQHVAATSPSMQLAQWHSDGPSLQGFDERFETQEDVRNFMPPHIENSGQQERSAILPESTTGSTFFTPYPNAMPAGISSLSDEDQLRSAQHISGHSFVRRTEPLTYKSGTLPSIHEEAFRQTLISRTFRHGELSSTPLRPSEDVIVLPHFQKYRIEGSTELTSADNIRSAGAGQMRMEMEVVAEATEEVEQTNIAQPLQQQRAVETKKTEEIISTEPLQLVQTPQESDGLNEPRNWLEILRERQVDLQYNNFGTLPKRRKRCHKKRAPRNSNLTHRVDQHVGVQTGITEVLRAMTPLPAQLPVAQTTAVDLTLTRHLNNIEETPLTAVQQPSYEQFVYEHIESISTIMDSLHEWESVLKACNRNSEQNALTALLPAHYAYDVETLLNADIERLQLKMNILQEIIRNVSFNMMRSRLLKNRRLAAVAFNFIIELESAGIIRIKENGHLVGLI